MKITVTISDIEAGEPLDIGFQYKGQTVLDRLDSNSGVLVKEYEITPGMNEPKIIGKPGKFVMKDGTFVPA